MISIITDSSSNISQREAKELGIIVMPLTIIFGTTEYGDGVNLDCDEFYKKLTGAKEFPHTAQLSETQIEEAIKEAESLGDEIIILPIAAALSGSFDRCREVAKRHEKVYTFDTACTTVMLKMLVLEALNHREKPAGEVVEILRAYRKKLRLYAALDTLEYLGKGGRLSKTSAVLGTVLKIKPVVILAGDGKVELVSKQFGFNRSISYIAEHVDKNRIDYSKPVFLIYTMNDSNAELLISKIGASYSEKCNICPVIGTHIGPDAAGFVYAEK